MNQPTNRTILNTIIAIGVIIIVILLLPRNAIPRYSYNGTGNLLSASATPFDTASPQYPAQMHFGNSGTTTYVTPTVYSGQPRYYTYTTTTTPQVSNDYGYLPNDGVNDYYVGCTSYTGYSTINGQYCGQGINY